VIVKEAVANGRLTAHGSPPPLAAAVAAELGVGLDALAIAAVLWQPWADVVLSGASSPAMLESNLAALRIPPDDALQERLRDLAEPAKSYWSARSRLAWN
jgi:aryl-alcohol dehydrogenase-like predicted oxidoreductase